jgi:hypothetical protein
LAGDPIASAPNQLFGEGQSPLRGGSNLKIVYLCPVVPKKISEVLEISFGELKCDINKNFRMHSTIKMF